jgi:hypothetical protein
VDRAELIVLGWVDPEVVTHSSERVPVRAELIFKGNTAERFYVEPRPARQPGSEGFIVVSSCDIIDLAGGHYMLFPYDQGGAYHVNLCTALPVDYNAASGLISTGAQPLDEYLTLLGEIAPPRPPPDADGGLPLTPATIFTLGVFTAGAAFFGWQVLRYVRARGQEDREA